MKNERWKLETSRKALLLKLETRKGLKKQEVYLKKCVKGNRCRGEHCQICLRIFRGNLIRRAKRLKLARKKSGWITLTLTPDDPPIPIGCLSGLDLEKYIEKHRQRLARHLPGVLIIGGLDIALKFEGDEASGWQPHFHLMIYGISREDSLKALRAAYPKSEHSPKPIRHEEVTGSFNGALSYTYKSVFFSRGRKGGVRSGKNRSMLPRKYELELRAFLAKWPIGCRILLRYAKFNGPKTSINRRLVLMAPFSSEFE
nr:hypothetical protein [uncultured Cohaesibacter sp.]